MNDTKEFIQTEIERNLDTVADSNVAQLASIVAAEQSGSMHPIAEAAATQDAAIGATVTIGNMAVLDSEQD